MLDFRAIKRKKPAFLFPIIPLGFVLTYQYDLGYGTLLQRMKEIMQFSTTKNAGPLNMRMEFIPTSQQELKTTLAKRQTLLKELLQQASPKDIHTTFEEFKKNGLQRQSEVENKSLSELKNIRLVKHFLKKREAPYLLSNKCCYIGCTKKEVAVFC
ncbi:prorelaxin isoform X4 [Pipistrellus kuhlii]|uniref:prorelaxin isoform X4 n=1 Tax=Pipistrellus kuhlii TaxID=59472 RepID=UPI00174F72A2|nr:prorelaxin isoform X4 [Pipistrellus kuhlii]XP_036289883.1 prorelaxin isoform X4 [Pipistrellus kuhlii]XP_036289884.1 prorelaxin isoform X4 [Pipistrellus kuhlii]